MVLVASFVKNIKKVIDFNGKINLWCTSGYRIMKLSKNEEPKNNEVHKADQELELQQTSPTQPDWPTTQIKE